MKAGAGVAAVAGLGLALFAGAAGLGFAIARRLTAPPSGRVYNLIVRGIVRHEGHDAVVLDRNPSTVATGVYNLWLEDGGWVRLGPVIGEDAVTVTRLIESTAPADALSVGQRASWSGIYYRDPADAGLDAEDVIVETPVGPAPAWLIRPAGYATNDWAIHIHGLASPRAGTLRGVKVAADAGFVSLVVTYRNDGEGPTVGSGRSTLGATEADDVRAAVRYAIAHGADRVVLFGWSMGGAIALQVAADVEFDGVIDRLVLDSPVIDWCATIAANCARAGLPPQAAALARPWLQWSPLARSVGLPSALPLGRFNWIDRATALPVHALILHGTDDTSAPPAAARRLAQLRPDMVQLETFRADHTLGWNSAWESWNRHVRDWLVGNETTFPDVPI
ncbi:alpha/beta fold hydrolase [Microbacterium sp.]|uniref:alpha/beta hydrolase family protein n=1 Tax=Microbacterium sp. TaxID=51671 RepID=UPI0026147191|nr:alpha/beta fold hydrolase [Microbacterium sp.]